MVTDNRRIFLIDLKAAKIRDLKEPYLIAKKAEGLRDPTLKSYEAYLRAWFAWLDDNGIVEIGQLTAQVIRYFLMAYKETHNQGGVHSVYRVIKAFLRWAWAEYDFDWANPISKVKCSVHNIPPIPGVDPQHIERLFSAAAEGTCPERDCAILAVLLDTGIRRASLDGIRCRDVDLIKGTIFINHVKAGKQYTAYLGKRARKYVRKYAQTLPEYLGPNDKFWRSKTGEEFRIDNFYEILVRLEDRAGVPRYSLHDFRRFFALQAYRNGADVYAVAQMLGHTGITVTERYLAVDEGDLATMHGKFSPLDGNR